MPGGISDTVEHFALLNGFCVALMVNWIENNEVHRPVAAQIIKAAVHFHIAWLAFVKPKE